jgi:hypothetical protein
MEIIPSGTNLCNINGTLYLMINIFFLINLKMTNTKENKIVAEYYTSLKTRQPSKLQQFNSIFQTKVRKWFLADRRQRL